MYVHSVPIGQTALCIEYTLSIYNTVAVFPAYVKWPFRVSRTHGLPERRFSCELYLFRFVLILQKSNLVLTFEQFCQELNCLLTANVGLNRALLLKTRDHLFYSFKCHAQHL